MLAIILVLTLNMGEALANELDDIGFLTEGRNFRYSPQTKVIMFHLEMGIEFTRDTATALKASVTEILTKWGNFPLSKLMLN